MKGTINNKIYNIFSKNRIIFLDISQNTLIIDNLKFL